MYILIIIQGKTNHEKKINKIFVSQSEPWARAGGECSSVHPTDQGQGVCHQEGVLRTSQVPLQTEGQGQSYQSAVCLLENQPPQGL